MNIFVCIKQVPDTTTRIKLREDGNGIDEADIQWIISPHDELAIEEALFAIANPVRRSLCCRPGRSG